MARRKTIYIPENNDFVLLVPMYLKSASGEFEPIIVSELNDVRVVVESDNAELDAHRYKVTALDDNCFRLEFDETLETGTYSVHVYAKLTNRDIATHIRECFGIVEWNDDSTYLNYISDGGILAPDSAFVLSVSGEDVESWVKKYNEEAEKALEAANNANNAAEKAIESIEGVDEAVSKANAAADKANQTEALVSSNEQDRQLREAGRVTNENLRQEREAGRISNENKRQEREAARISHEEERKANEQQRQANDESREARTNAAIQNANTAADTAAEAARLADAARQQLTTTFNEKVAALEADYAQKKAALDADYAGVKQSLSADYANTKIALETDYTQKKAALDADYASAKSALSTAYAEAIASLNQRMSAIETQYATDKVEWQRQVDAILAKFEQDFATAEAAREERVALAIAHADTAAGNANAAATQAGNVNAVLDGDNLTVTDRNGQSVTRNVRGPQGEPGASVTFFPAVTIFGQPHIEGPQISGFSANDYLQFPFVVNFAGRPWELHFDIATGAEVNQQHNIFDSQFGLAFAFANGHFVMAMSSNGTSWDLGAPEGTHAILPNQTYHIRMSWDGSVYKLEFSTDEVTWTTDITVSSTASLYPRQIVIGKDIFTGTHFYNGSINFAHAQLTIAGVVVWEGMAEVGTATRMALDMSNIDDAGKSRLNTIAMEGEVGQKIATKQDKLIAGDGINIAEDGKTINASMATPSGEPMHYLFVNAGAVWNAQTKFWELNGLTDITNEQMRSIYNNQINFAGSSFVYGIAGKNIRTNIVIPSQYVYAVHWYGGTISLERFASLNSTIKIIRLFNETVLTTSANVSSLYSAFYKCTNLREIYPILSVSKITSSTNLNAFTGCNKLEIVSLSGLKLSISLTDSPLLSNASILYMVANSSATSAITITLHADAYARAMADAKIVTALEAKPFVSLASA